MRNTECRKYSNVHDPSPDSGPADLPLGALACGMSLLRHVRQQNFGLHHNIELLVATLLCVVSFVERRNNNRPAMLQVSDFYLSVSLSYTQKQEHHASPSSSNLAFRLCGLRAAGIGNRCTPARALKIYCPYRHRHCAKEASTSASPCPSLCSSISENQ